MDRTKLDHALELAAEGFWLFPVEPGGKVPAIKSWPQMASRDAERLRAWWGRNPDYNIGIHTGRFGDARKHGEATRYDALLAVDVDTKPGKVGSASLFALEAENGELPDTRENLTASGGRHILFRVEQALRNSAGTLLGRDLDTRSHHGYILGPGSTVDGRRYSVDQRAPIAPAPAWLVDRCRQRVPGPDQRGADSAFQAERADVDARGREYLAHAALAIEGHGGDHATFAVACWLRDLGADEAHAYQLLLDHWNDRCSPPWPADELLVKVRNAYAYSQNAQGAKAVEQYLKPLPEMPAAKVDDSSQFPLAKFNDKHAIVIAGGGVQVIWETTDPKGGEKLEHLSLGAFHTMYAPEKIRFGNKEVQQSQAWVEWRERRSYDGFVFDPSATSPARFYNLWRGFAVEPWPADVAADPRHERAVKMLEEHIFLNVCDGDADLAQWLWGYFAQLVQRPRVKPPVALVLKGLKGVGKNAVFDAIGTLLGSSFLLTANRRYLMSNFNGHLENLLLFVLDEAFWSGDKQAEGVLKDLITGKTHQIEHKGKEPFTVDNLTRVGIIGNEEWLVPASHDERRYAVFNVGAGRQGDKPFFGFMLDTLAAGANRLLLRRLLDFDLSTVDVMRAPSTEGLLEQKHATLEPLPQFWYECVSEGYLVCGEMGQEWAEEIECERVRLAFKRWARERNVRTRLPSDVDIGRALKLIMPDLLKTKKTLHGARTSVYIIPSLSEARAAWSRHIGHEVVWGT